MKHGLVCKRRKHPKQKKKKHLTNPNRIYKYETDYHHHHVVNKKNMVKQIPNRVHLKNVRFGFFLVLEVNNDHDQCVLVSSTFIYPK